MIGEDLQFRVILLREEERGFYRLMYHNCYNYAKPPSERFPVSFDVWIR